jgi:hypothetical protein
LERNRNTTAHAHPNAACFPVPPVVRPPAELLLMSDAALKALHRNPLRRCGCAPHVRPQAPPAPLRPRRALPMPIPGEHGSNSKAKKIRKKNGFGICGDALDRTRRRAEERSGVHTEAALQLLASPYGLRGFR